MTKPDQTTAFIAAAHDALLIDIGRLECRAAELTRRDRFIVHAGSLSKGLTFHTVELPALGRALDRAMAGNRKLDITGDWIVDDGVPVFLRELWLAVFDTTGTLRSDPSPTAVRLLRQVAYLAYKLVQDIDSQVVEDRVVEHLRLDQELPAADEVVNLTRTTELTIELARLIMSYMFERGVRTKDTHRSGEKTGKYVTFDPSDIVPSHGPGAVADRVAPHEKFRWRTFYTKLDAEYPYSEYMHFNYTHLCDSLTSFLSLKETDVGYAKLAAVPKDSRGPRLISLEPLEYQWIQQGLGRRLVDHIEECPLTRGYVNFSDQTINRTLALGASLTQEWDTLDLKDASDRVSLWLVRQLFPVNLLRKLEAARTAGTCWKDRNYPYRKFAPMGSALCFPVESLVFWALVTARLSLDHVRSGYGGLLNSLTPVYVFGDDLVVPHGTMPLVSDLFKELFLELNEDKCCHGSFFRESCGCDAFQGVDVTPIKIRHYGHDPNSLIALCEYAKHARISGYHLTAELLFGVVESLLGPLPWTSDKQQPLHRWNPDVVACQLLNLKRSDLRLNADLCRLEYKCWQPQSCVYSHEETDWNEMWRCWTGARSVHPLAFLERERSLSDYVAPLFQWFGLPPRPRPGVCGVARRVKLTRRWRGFD